LVVSCMSLPPERSGARQELSAGTLGCPIERQTERQPRPAHFMVRRSAKGTILDRLSQYGRKT
jgi:hypothetical protein